MKQKFLTPTVTVVLWAIGSFIVFLLSYWQSPAPNPLILSAVLAAIVSVCICVYTILRKPEWAIWVFIMCPIFPMQVSVTWFGASEYESWQGQERVVDYVKQILYSTQWFAVFLLTFMCIVICLGLFLNLHRRYHETSLNSS